MQTFPDYLRRLAEGYAETPENAVDRTEMEKGPPKQRQVLSRVMVSRPMNYLAMGQQAYDDWREWFKSIGRGAAWFWWKDPLRGTLKRARIQGGTVSQTLIIAGQKIWKISFTLETWE